MSKQVMWVLAAILAIVGCDKKSKDAASGTDAETTAAREPTAATPTDPPAAAPDGGTKLVAMARAGAATGAADAGVAPVTAPVDAAVAVAVAEPEPPVAEPVAAPVDAGALAVAEPAAPAKLKAGDKIQAKWSDGYSYPAKIVKVNASGSYDILYDDGTRVKSQPKKKVRARKVSKGGSSKAGGGCGGGRTKCGGRCVDLQNDPRNCWSCGRTCPEACMGGSCVSNAYKYGE